MKNESISGLEPRKIAHLVGLTLNDVQNEMGDDSATIGELLQIRLEEAGYSADEKAGAWPKAIERWLRPRRAGARRSVGEFLLDSRSPLRTIKEIRRGAKDRAARTDDDAERTVMTTIYFAAIANRLVFHGQRLTTYSHKDLCSSFEKLRAQPWMPAALVELFAKAEQACQEKMLDRRRSQEHSD